jgi:5'-deoxynucleotidase YfbR-like HD superfamily hydrolase
VRFPKKTATEEVVEKISKLKGPNKAERGGLMLLANAFASQDTQLQRRSAHITHNMLVALNKAFPEVDRQLIGDIVADLDSLWDTGQKLDKELKKLFQMRFPQHRSHLADFLAFIEATQIDMVEFWIGNLRKRVPKLRKDLDRQERNERRRARTKPPKQPRKVAKQMRA